MNQERLQEEDPAGSQARLQEEDLAGSQEEVQVGFQEAGSQEEPAGSQEGEPAGSQEGEPAGSQEEEQAGSQEEESVGSQEEEQARSQETGSQETGSQEEEEAGSQEEEARSQEEEQAGSQETGSQEEEQAESQETESHETGSHETGSQEEEQAGSQEEEQAGSQEEEPGEFSWCPSYDTQPTDFTLVVASATETWKFYVHRDILLKSSDYFSAMFSSQMIESREGVVNLQLVTPEVFTILVEAMYTGEFELTQENAFEVVKAAEMLQIQDPLKSEYIVYLRNTFINLRHCFQLMDFCIPLGLQGLYYDARKFCLAHLSELKSSTTLTSLSLSKLYDYLSDKYLLVESEIQILEVIHIWLCANKNTDPYNSPNYNLRDKVKKMITECVSLKEKQDEVYDFVTDEVFSDEWLPAEYFESAFYERPRKEEVFMFMAKLTSRNYGLLTDILKLNLDTGYAIKVGTMTNIVEQPGFFVSAACCSGPYVYLSAGGNEFGLQIWRFDVSKPYSIEEAVGDRFEFRCDHAMVILEHKLYIFGGLGKNRVDNLQMHSLDLATGYWKKLPSMPLHACNPPTATDDNCIYYLNPRWILCSFSLQGNNWTYMYTFTEIFPEMHDKCRPLNLFPFVSGKTKCFVVATLTNSSLKILSHVILEAKVTEVRDMAIDFDFAHSVAANGKLVFFFTSNKSNDPSFFLNLDSTALQTACIFDPQTKELHYLPSIQNVKQARAVVALPYFPDEFCMKPKEPL